MAHSTGLAVPSCSWSMYVFVSCYQGRYAKMIHPKQGMEDEIFPIDDYLLCLQHGDPKEARCVPREFSGIFFFVRPDSQHISADSNAASYPTRNTWASRTHSPSSFDGSSSFLTSTRSPDPFWRLFHRSLSTDACSYLATLSAFTGFVELYRHNKQVSPAMHDAAPARAALLLLRKKL